jgi:hypothetical protein
MSSLAARGRVAQEGFVGAGEKLSRLPSAAE